MPLPPALLARLQKRGIVTKRTQSEKKALEEVEEVFAIDYDEPANATQTAQLPQQSKTSSLGSGKNPPAAKLAEEPTFTPDGTLLYEVRACPNRTNPYHECADYCMKTYGLKAFNADKDMTRKKNRMLSKYPLPPGWEEVADPNTNRCYYWNTGTDEVCWLSPLHPRAIVSLPADRLIELAQFQEEEPLVDNMPEIMETDDFDVLESKIRSSSSSGTSSSGGGYKKRKYRGNDDDELDPMDPSSYSDVPRGSWSSGLDVRGSAKTGVDATASGPLFQQRPYPSPGDVLRANRKLDEPSR
ncbi:polyglutamine-binding protein 1-like [Tubulanus polymorphus]|uniref:polyglutamine-binding protein 1-like n=1 Tax=Tubulanus polymorphus TaxID=672921 RepID=UPI003DA4C19D